MIKVLYKFIAQHHQNSRCHQRITPEIKIQLQRIACGPKPGKGRGNALKPDHLKIIPQNSDSVRQKHFHPEADHEILEAILKLLRAALSSCAELPVVITHDRTGNHLGKHGKIQGCGFQIRFFPDIPPVHIHLKRNHLKNIEADSEREQGAVNKRTQAFEQRKHSHIQNQDKNKQPFSFSLLQGKHLVAALLLLYLPSNEMIHKGKRKKEKQKHRLAHCIKKKASQKQDIIPAS